MAATGKKKILVVDDEPDVVKMLKMRLEVNGYEVISAGEGNEGYAKAKSDAPDLILLDVMLPGMDGYQVCKLLKSDQNYQRTPIIMLTAKSQQEDRQGAEDAGADCYVTKPFDAKELLQHIKVLTGG
jgi:DNA-binding response OmpR family regulator